MSTGAQSLFPLGRLLSTPGALEALAANRTTPSTYLGRHATGDWSECKPEDAKLNEHAVRDGERVFSVYRLPDRTKIWIITEWDRSATTILLPEEY